MFSAITLEGSLKPFKEPTMSISAAYGEKFIAVAENSANRTPELDEDRSPISDEVIWHGFVGRHKNGKLSFLMPFEKSQSRKK